MNFSGRGLATAQTGRRHGHPEAAGVKVLEHDSKVKWAAAHDFRRSFGSRWAKRVMPAVLMRLMRHRTMGVTMTYYATADAESVAEAAYQSVSHTDGKKAEKPAEISLR